MSAAVAPGAQRFVAHAMGMPISLALRGAHAEDSAGVRAWEDVLAQVVEVDRMFSTYRADSFVSRLGRGEVTIDGCPPEVVEVLDLGERAAERSDGAFSVWRDDRTGARRLDTDGIVKGWAIERAAAALRRLPDTDFCLSAGGDMVCHTASPAGQAWVVGIEDPLDAARLVATVRVRRGAVATSGSAHRGDHVVDARTGRPPTGVASVTVVADRLTWADIDATSSFARGPEAAAWLEQRPGRVGLVVWKDGSTTTIGRL